MLATFLILAAATTTPIDFAAAKSLADQDEASLPKIGMQALRTAQSGVLDRAADACRTEEPLKPFVIVLELDAKGMPVNHWRDADTQLAQCMEGKLSQRMFYVPPRAPFHVSFEVSFTP